MEKKNLYREYFPGYMGHIPLKYEIIGKTVGATNHYIKSLLTKEPDYSQTFVPALYNDYTYYNKLYFNDGTSKKYELEEDKIYSNRSKDARTWINGYKHNLYPEHIPGYTGHVSGIEQAGKKGCSIFGCSYAKATSIAVKGNYNRELDVPPEQRYLSEQRDNYQIPKLRSKEEMDNLLRKNEENEKITKKALDYFDQLKPPSNLEKMDKNQKEYLEAGTMLSDKFKDSVNFEKKTITELPYIVGYKGFRRGVVANNYYGKNFKEVSLTSVNRTGNEGC